MMGWHGHGWGSGWGLGSWLGMGLGAIVLWVLFALAIVAAVRWARGSRVPTALAGSTPLLILDERFARGELNEEDYRARREVLTGARS